MPNSPDLELCWGTVERATPEELVAVAAAAGFGSVAIAPMSVLGGAADPRVLRVRLDDAGVRARVIDAILSWLPGSPDPRSVEERFRALFAFSAEECLDLAEELGSSVVNVAHFLGSQVETGRMAQSLAELAERAADRSLSLTVEFIPGTGIPDLGFTAELIAAAGAGNVSIMVDSWHLARSGGSAADLRALPAGLVGGVQLSDRIEPAPGSGYRPMEDRLLPGQGRLPLGEMVRAITSANPGVPIGVEVFSSQLRSLPPIEAARAAAEAVRSILP